MSNRNEICVDTRQYSTKLGTYGSLNKGKIVLNPVGWFEIYVDDMSRAKTFYEAVLCLELSAITDPTQESFVMWGFPSDMEQYGASGALVHCEGFKAGGNSTLVYFACEDCALEESRVVTAGGKVERPKMSLGEHGFCTLAIDSEGNMFGLHSQS